MKFSKIWIILILPLVLGYLHKNDLLNFYQKLRGELPKIEQLATNLATEVKKEVNNPPPLRAEKESPSAFLTIAGTINQTNIQRTNNGLPALKENKVLDQTAAKKLQDMFSNQYFAHESPSGVGVDGLAKEAGYSYITIGENLALGNFESDAVLITAWMNSPGHRANILNTKYTEIGVAVGKGMYEGRETWIAVQHFGKPLSDCPSPDASLKNKIETEKAQADQMASDLEQKRQTLDRSNKSQVDSYNKEVEQYNNLVRELKSLIDQYNRQIAAFNQCAS